MKSIIGEIWRIPHRGVIINGDDGKDYVLLCDQKIRYIFFPFLLWMCPLEFIEVKKDSIQQAQDNSWVMSIAPAIGLTAGPILEKLSDQTLINIPISTSNYWMIVLSIGLLARIIFRNNKRPDSENIIAIHHAKLKPLKRYYVMRAFMATLLGLGFIWVGLWAVSFSAAEGQIILLIFITYMVYAFSLFNYPFVDVAKARITFLD
ncbi:MAG: DUF443 family protein [Firmicutes bacterium]|uniref:DUF443 family protein n=1 Tax=Candidatus Gallilactobacillus intestinavium TaxID=2840838 RepID=A0A9D9E7K9_9LACO|nr:DUF443 family protein [Candidatus Gallilactobacillus intestinavium]